MLEFTPDPPFEPMPADEIPFGMEGVIPAIAVLPRVYAPIPPGLEKLEPGPVLAGYLASIDVATLSGHDQVIALRAHQRMASHYQANLYSAMTALTDTVAESFGDEPESRTATDGAAAEIQTALHLTRRAAETELAFAMAMRRRLPRLAEMLRNGEIDLRRARTIDRSTSHLPIATARAVVGEIADTAPTRTTGQLEAQIRKLCISADPMDANVRYAAAVSDRRIVAEANDTGTANLVGMDLAPDQVSAIARRINAIARGLNGKHEARTMDQLRADVYLDLLNGTSGSGREHACAGVVDITVDLATLTGLVDEPGDLAGYGPVVADIARHILDEQQGSEWRVTVTDTKTGQTTHQGTTSRRPSMSQRRRIETRDRTCVFPGCRMPATQSDIDHIKAFQDGGRTIDNNLAPLCRHHHRLKHTFGWMYEHRSDLGWPGYEWLSPFGHRYRTGPSETRPPP